ARIKLSDAHGRASAGVVAGRDAFSRPSAVHVDD
ncbi:hypothetical protein J2S00_002452, partial [Caldalkalibacillus uzonensis]|nr:hypothetical protein [Caldalkalibacillus uzonensis]